MGEFIMSKLTRTRRFFGIFFIVFFYFFIFNGNTLNVQAFTENDVKTNLANIDDGIYNWRALGNNPSNQIGSIPIGPTVSLDYTFGAARNSANKIQSGDKTITTPSSTATGAIYNSKINVFLNDNGKYYGIIHQGSGSYIGGNPEKASDTSPDFVIASGQNLKWYSENSLLMKLENKVFFVGSDANKKPVYKIGGYVSNRGLYAEVVLRPSLTGAPIVQRELYLYNPASTKSADMQVYFGEDTSIDSTGAPAVDDVPLYAIGNGEGLFMYSAKDPNASDAKLFVTNDSPGGFKDFMGEIYYSPYNWNNKGKKYVSATQGGGDLTMPNLKWYGDSTNVSNGDTSRAPGARLLYAQDSYGNESPVVDPNGKQNSAYLLRWEHSGIDAGSYRRYTSTIGATVAKYALPTVSKTYTNSNQNADGTNNVGDTLHFKLTGVNNGFKSNWELNDLVDNMPTGLTLDPGSVHYRWVDVKSSGTGESQADHETLRADSNLNTTFTQNNAINYHPDATVGEKGRYTVTFNATVNNKAPYNVDKNGDITNKATFTGTNSAVNTGTKSYNAEVNIPIKTPRFNYEFTKQIKNDTTNPNGAFSSSADGKKGDTIAYELNFTNTGTDTLKSANFSDVLPSELKLDPNSITMNNVKESSLNFQLPNNPTNSPVTIRFKATVTGIEKKTVSNIADITNVTTNGGESFTDLKSDSALLNIAETRPTTSFVEVPTTIDFGSVQSAGNDKMLPNVRTDGKLIVDHSSDTPFQVKVSYDNNNDPIKNGDTKLIQDNGNALYFDQCQSDNTNDWHSLSTEALPIKSDGFKGSYDNFDMSNYIGMKKWKLRVPSGTKSGNYTGKVTWSIEDTPQL